MYPQVYANQKVVQGLMAYAARLKGELARADRERRFKRADHGAVQARRAYYAGLLANVERVGASLAPGLDWVGIKAKVTLQDGYRTTPGELRTQVLRQLKSQSDPISVNALHERIIEAMGLAFATPQERQRHRAVIVDALHDLRKGPPALVECAHKGRFGCFDQPEQLWRLKRLR